MISIDDQVQPGNDERSLHELLPISAESAVDQLIEAERREVVHRAIDSLPDRERTVMHLYYHNRCSLKEIGEELGLTESRICQLRSAAIRRLHGRLASEA